jgi:hypothetical protein
MNTPYLDDLLAKVAQRNKYAYVIRSITRGRWYFFDVDTTTDPHGVKWTHYINRAFWFPDEQSVEEFRTDFITPRLVEILRIDRTRRK